PSIFIIMSNKIIVTFKNTGRWCGMSTCFFIGHRNTPDTVLPALMQEVERHITEYGVTDFVVGHYGRFDTLAARAVIDAKQRHPAVTLTMLLPYHPAERPIPAPEGYDDT